MLLNTATHTQKKTFKISESGKQPLDGCVQLFLMYLDFIFEIGSQL